MTYISRSTLSTPDAGFSADQSACLDAVVAQTEALNAAIARAVDAGLIVEVVRSRRYHTAASTWGDQISPRVE